MRTLDRRFSHNMRAQFAHGLYNLMIKNENVYFLTGDLGYKIFDDIKTDFPERFINCGAAEQAMMGMAVGLAQAGKVPFVYSITPFLLYRPFETIRTYINHESVPVIMVGGGRNKDYRHDGFSHDASDDVLLMRNLNNIYCKWPTSDEEISTRYLEHLINKKAPVYLNLER